MRKWFLTLLLLLVASPVWGDVARPNSHYEPNTAATTSPTQAYDTNIATSGDTDLQSNNGTDAIYYGQDSANNDSWEGPGTAQAGCTLYVRYGATDNGNDIGDILVESSVKTTLYTVVNYTSAASIAATWWSQGLTSGQCADYADLRITVYTDRVGGADNTSYLHVYDIYVDYTAVGARQRMINMGQKEEAQDEKVYASFADGAVDSRKWGSVR